MSASRFHVTWVTGLTVAGLLAGASAPARADCSTSWSCDDGSDAHAPSVTVTNQGPNTYHPLTELTTAALSAYTVSATAGRLDGGSGHTSGGNYSITSTAWDARYPPTYECSVVYSAPITLEPYDAAGGPYRRVTWTRPQDFYPSYSGWVAGTYIYNSPRVSPVRGDNGATQVLVAPNSGAPTGTGLQDMDNAVVLAGSSNIAIQYQGSCSWSPGYTWYQEEPDPNNPGQTIPVPYTNSWNAIVDRWRLVGQNLRQVRGCADEYTPMDECFTDPMITATPFNITVPSPPTVQTAAPRRDLARVMAHAYTDGGAIGSVPDAMWQLVNYPSTFGIIGGPATRPNRYFGAGIPSQDPAVPGRSVEFMYNFKVGLDSVTWTLTNIDSGGTLTFPDLSPPAQDPASGSISPSTPWFNYTFQTAGHYRLTAVEHFSVSYWVYYYECYPGCFVDYSRGYQPYPGTTFDLTATTNGQPYLDVQVGQVEGVPVTPEG